MSRKIQPRIAEPILSQDQGEPGPEWKRGSGVRKGSLVLYRGNPRYVYDLRFRYVHSPDRPCWPDDLPGTDEFPGPECHRLPFKRAVTYVKIAEGWVPFSQVKLSKL